MHITVPGGARKPSLLPLLAQHLQVLGLCHRAQVSEQGSRALPPGALVSEFLILALSRLIWAMLAKIEDWRMER